MDIETAKHRAKESHLCEDCKKNENTPKLLMEAAEHGSVHSAFFNEYGTHGYSLLLEEFIRRAGWVAAENPKMVEELRRGMRILCPWLNK